MSFDDTIAAISTPIGHGGIGIVRLSGKDAIRITEAVFVSPGKKHLKNTLSHRIIYGHILSPDGEIIDEALVSVMRAPRTYTREDIVEINCHGGPVPLRRILELILKKGARLAEPGEFTRRAFLNGRIDLAQAEAVLDVINAMTGQSQQAAIEQLRGGLSKKIEPIRQELIDIAVFIEAHIDFPEDDIEPQSLQSIRRRSLNVQQALGELIEGSQYGVILREGLRTAIIGRPNVGKSSLLNALLEQDRAIVTESPGTTRDIIEDYLNLQGLPIKIMDTAGIRDVEGIAEKEGVKRSLSAMKGADLVLIVLDGSKVLHKTDRELIEKSNPGNTILIINKTDLPQKIKIKESKGQVSRLAKDNKNPPSPSPPPIKGEGTGESSLSPEASGRGIFSGHIVKISALKGSGLDKLKDKIVEIALHGKPSYGGSTVTNIRHVHALKQALKAVGSFIKEADKKTPPEYLSVDLKEALDAVGEITGITTSEDILNKIFSNFCIGK